MPATFIYKPGTSKGPVVLLPAEGPRSGVTIRGPNGQTYEGRYLNTNEGRHQYVFPRDVIGLQGSTVEYAGQSGSIGSGMQSYEGSSFSDWKPRNKGSIGGGGGSFLPPGATGGGSSGFSALPFYMGGFPQFQPVNFPSIGTAPYDPIDVEEFGRDIAELNTNQVRKNFGVGKEFALDTLRTELEGLRGFAPAAAALAREQIGLDNPFNQQQRTSMVDTALPGMRRRLEAQGRRADIYASGHLPDSIEDSALDVNSGSRSADEAGYSGFGARSGQARNTAALRSAEERFQIAQYGEGLFGQNLQARENLELAPTEYAQTGSQIRVMPEVGAGRLAVEATGMLNSSTLLSPATALSAEIQQGQFGTQLEQRTREFNATGVFDANKFNSAGQLQASLAEFGYNVSYLNAVQGANQGNLNGAAAINFQGMQNEAFSSGLENAQGTQAIISTIQGIGAIAGQGGFGGIQQIAGSALPDSAPVGETSVDTAPVETPQGDLGDTNPAVLRSAGAVSAAPMGVDASTPGGMKFAAGVEAPQGYTRVAGNSDGTYSAVPTADYGAELARFARSNNVPKGSIKVQNAAIADRNLSNSAGLSYIPIQGFQQMALSSGGKPVYSLPALAESGDISLGMKSVSNLQRFAAAAGVADPELHKAMNEMTAMVGDPEIHGAIDKALAERGPDAAAQVILNKLNGKTPNLETDEGQQLAFGAQRIAGLWGGLSPAQRSLALSSLANAATKSRTGQDIGEKEVPNTARSVMGPLKVKNIASITSRGANGLALARNWGQLSALGKITGAKSPEDVAALAGHIGSLGFGPQGAAVPVRAEELRHGEAAPAFGVGAMVFENEAQIPKNYQAVSRTPDKKFVALPANLAHTSPLSGKNKVHAFDKSSQVARGIHPAQGLWAKEAPFGRHIRGSAGGSAVLSSLSIMAEKNPHLLGSLIAYSMYSN